MFLLANDNRVNGLDADVVLHDNVAGSRTLTTHLIPSAAVMDPQITALDGRDDMGRLHDAHA